VLVSHPQLGVIDSPFWQLLGAYLTLDELKNIANAPAGTIFQSSGDTDIALGLQQLNLANGKLRSVWHNGKRTEVIDVHDLWAYRQQSMQYGTHVAEALYRVEQSRFLRLFETIVATADPTDPRRSLLSGIQRSATTIPIPMTSNLGAHPVSAALLLLAGATLFLTQKAPPELSGRIPAFEADPSEAFIRYFKAITRGLVEGGIIGSSGAVATQLAMERSLPEIVWQSKPFQQLKDQLEEMKLDPFCDFFRKIDRLVKKALQGQNQLGTRFSEFLRDGIQQGRSLSELLIAIQATADQAGLTTGDELLRLLQIHFVASYVLQLRGQNCPPVDPPGPN